LAQIVLDQVDKVYQGGVKALDDLNLGVREGEFMVLVGPSGCGKSTALRSIAGLEEITGGTISIGERVVLERDDGPCVTFAGLRLPLPAALLDSRAGLAGYLGRKVILGVRPSHFEDAAFGDASWPRIPVTVSVTEELGTEIHAIFPIDAPPVEHASIASTAAGKSEEDETVGVLAGGRSLWTARVSSRSAARPGQPLELAVDSGAVHFFDPDNGESIGTRP
jgi:ABC-type sugar transport system ATPase subunit